MFRAALTSPFDISAGQITKGPSSRVPQQALPDQYTLGELYEELCAFSGESLEEDVRSAMVLECCVWDSARIRRTPSHVEDFQKILGALARFVRRAVSAPLEDEAEDISLLERRTSAAEAALSVAVGLHGDPACRAVNVDPAFLLSAIACSDRGDSWTSVAAQKLALELLDMHQTQLLEHSFIVNYILIGFVRPLFSNLKPAEVSSQGRKALNPTSKRHPSYVDDPFSKPWKFRDVYAITVFHWAVSNADEATVQKNWHLLIPPLLTLVDDPTTSVRERGLYVFNDLLSKIPGKFLESTGLGEVFEDAVMPTLLFLPSITPVEDSLKLLKPAYSVLFRLGDVLFPAESGRSGKLKFLDRIMRQGVLQGFLYSRDDANIAQLLIQEADALICRMGIHAIKHLKDVIPLLSDILLQPFSPSQPILLLATVKATQSTILNCWPRMTEPFYRNGLIKAFIICWNNVNEEIVINSQQKSHSQLEEVKEGLKLAARALVQSLEGRFDTKQELELLVSIDPPISELFGLNTVDAGISLLQI